MYNHRQPLGACTCLFAEGTRLFPAAFRADPPEEDVVARELEAVAVADVFLQIGDAIHIHIEDAAALFAPDMVMLVAEVVKAVRPVEELQLADAAHPGKAVQVPVHGRPADGGMLPDDFLIDLLRSGVALQPVYRIVDQSGLDGVAFHNENHSLIGFFTNNIMKSTGCQAENENKNLLIIIFNKEIVFYA